MKKFLTSLMVVVALAVGATAHADTIERDSDGNLTINMFASLIESFRVAISSADLVGTGSDGIIDLNGGLLGYDALQSILGGSCTDDAGIGPTYLGATSCVLVGDMATASGSALRFTVLLDVLVEISGPGTVSLAASLQGPGAGLASFTNIIFFGFQSAGGPNLTGLQDQDTDVLEWQAESPLNGGPDYDETIIVAVTKQ
jgi:hypothetical protein